MIAVDKLECATLYGMIQTTRDKGLSDVFVGMAHYISDNNRTELYDVYHDYRKFFAAFREELFQAFGDSERFYQTFCRCVVKYKEREGK